MEAKKKCTTTILNTHLYFQLDLIVLFFATAGCCYFTDKKKSFLMLWQQPILSVCWPIFERFIFWMQRCDLIFIPLCSLILLKINQHAGAKKRRWTRTINLNDWIKSKKKMKKTNKSQESIQNENSSCFFCSMKTKAKKQKKDR